MIFVALGTALGALAVHHGALWSVQRRLLFPGAYMGAGEIPRRPDV